MANGRCAANLIFQNETFPNSFARSPCLERKCRCWGTAQHRLRALQRALGTRSAADSGNRWRIGFRWIEDRFSKNSGRDGRNFEDVEAAIFDCDSLDSWLDPCSGPQGGPSRGSRPMGDFDDGWTVDWRLRFSIMMDTLFDFDLLRRGGVPRARICDCDGLRLDVLAAPPCGGSGSQLTTRYSIATWLRSALSARSSLTPTSARRRGRGDCEREESIWYWNLKSMCTELAAADPVNPSPTRSSFKFGCATGTWTWLGGGKSMCSPAPPAGGPARR